MNVNKRCYFPDPCSGVQCGLGSCRAENHLPVCYCQEGYAPQNGRCVDINECQDKNNSPCHPSAVCSNTPGGFKCSCAPGQVGDAYSKSSKAGCKPKAECQTSADCPLSSSCEGGRCVDPCREGRCGRGADCSVRNHQPYCQCPIRTSGDPRYKIS